MYYSKTTGGFYCAEVHGESMPFDAVEITKEAHQTLLNGQTAGRVIAADASGIPVLIDAPVFTPTVAQQLAALDASHTLTQRNLRETVMLMAEAFKTLSGGQLDLSSIPGVAKVYEVEAQAAALRGGL